MTRYTAQSCYQFRKLREIEMAAEDQSIDQTDLKDQVEEITETLEDVVSDNEGAESSEQNKAESADSVLLEEIQALKDQLLRGQAEMHNLRRRTEKDVQKAHKFGQEKLIKELLPVIDNFERAIETASEGEENPVLEGVKMTQGLMLAAVEKFDVVVVDPMGEPFDPQLHQAMSMIENPLVESNTVIAVMQKGYTLAGRLLRPAMVMVSKGGTVEPSSIDEKA